MKHVYVKTWDEALDAIDGKKYKYDGVAGTFRVDRSRKHDTRVEHHPSATGKKSETYLTHKRQLHDDYITDLSFSEKLVPVMERLGIRFGEMKHKRTR